MNLSLDKIWTIIRKDWMQVYKRRSMLLSLFLMPLLFAAMPLGILVAMRSELASEGVSAAQTVDADLPEQFKALCPVDLSAGDCMQVFMVSQFMLLFMLIPMAIPTSLASYSIVGEKSTRSLEPLLATPVSTLELMLAKGLGALIPAVAATYLAFAVFAAGVFLLAPDEVLRAALLDARWLIAVFLVGPLAALMAVSVSMMVSSRVNDPRVSEQLSMVVIIPVMGLFFGQIAGLFIIDRNLILIAAVGAAILDGVLVYFAVRLFQRESILTRWK